MENLAADRACLGMRVGSFDQGFHPSRLNLRIVVKQDQQFAACQVPAPIAGSRQAKINGRADHMDACCRSSQF